MWSDSARGNRSAGPDRVPSVGGSGTSPATIPSAFAAAASRASLLSLSSSSCVFFFAGGSADAGGSRALGGGTMLISGTISGTASTPPASSTTVPMGASLEAFGSARATGAASIALAPPAPEPSPRVCRRSPPAPSPSALAFSAICALVSSSRSLAFSSAGAAAESTLLSASVSLASALAAAWASHDMLAARDSECPLRNFETSVTWLSASPTAPVH